MNVGRPLVVALLCATLLGGCGDDPEPKFDPPLETSSVTLAPSTSSSPHPRSPEDVIRAWFKAGNEMQLNGDTTDFRALSKHCASCNRFARTVERIYARGGYVKTRGERVVKIERVAKGTYDVDVMGAPTRYRESEAAPEKSLPGGPNGYRLALGRSNGKWFVTNSLDRT